MSNNESTESLSILILSFTRGLVHRSIDSSDWFLNLKIDGSTCWVVENRRSIPGVKLLNKRLSTATEETNSRVVLDSQAGNWIFPKNSKVGFNFQYLKIKYTVCIVCKVFSWSFKSKLHVKYLKIQGFFSWNQFST